MTSESSGKGPAGHGAPQSQGGQPWWREVWCPVVAIVMNAHLALRISETGSTDRASVRLGDAGDKASESPASLAGHLPAHLDGVARPELLGPLIPHVPPADPGRHPAQLVQVGAPVATLAVRVPSITNARHSSSVILRIAGERIGHGSTLRVRAAAPVRSLILRVATPRAVA